MRRIDSRTAAVAAAGVALALVALSLFVGAAALAPADVVAALAGRGRASHATIVLAVRLPRALLALVVGAALSASGIVFQGLFRNPLADPFVMGVSGGAGLGAVLAIVSGVGAGALGMGGVTSCAFIGAALSVALVWSLAGTRGRVPLATLLLAGFAVGAFTSALVSVLLLMNTKSWGEVLLWTLGSVDRGDIWVRVRLATPLVAAGIAITFVCAKELNAMLLGEDEARRLGVDVERMKAACVFAAALSTATAVALCGIIGFVGLVVPHAARLLVGPDHRALLPVAVLGGGAFLLAADILGRALYAPSGLPVGTITALAGVPFFLHLLRRRARGATS
jgi:iron complex transport system permease protein